MSNCPVHSKDKSQRPTNGQLVSTFDLMIFWTIKSALILVSGMSLLIVEKFPRAGLQMVREANGQDKSRFTPSMVGTILVMTVSHYYSACEHMLLRFQRPYFEWRNSRSKLHILLVLWYQLLFLQFCMVIIYTLGFFFLGGSGQHIFPAFVAFGSRSAKFLSSVVQQLQIFFHKPVDFPGFG